MFEQFFFLYAKRPGCTRKFKFEAPWTKPLRLLFPASAWLGWFHEFPLKFFTSKRILQRKKSWTIPQSIPVIPSPDLKGFYNRLVSPFNLPEVENGPKHHKNTKSSFDSNPGTKLEAEVPQKPPLDVGQCRPKLVSAMQTESKGHLKSNLLGTYWCAG